MTTLRYLRGGGGSMSDLQSAHCCIAGLRRPEWRHFWLGKGGGGRKVESIGAMKHSMIHVVWM
jgi:hypothetical protein